MSEPMNPEDALNKWSEQISGLADAAAALWGFYSALTKQGFDGDQALALTIEWMLLGLGGRT